MGRRMAGIAVTDTAALEAHIDGIRGNALAWTFSAASVRRIAAEAESRLAAMSIFPTYRAGARAVAVSRGPEAKAYRNHVNGSRIALVRAHDGWRLVSYERVPVFPCAREKIDLQISREQHDRSVQAMLRDARVTVMNKKEAA